MSRASWLSSRLDFHMKLNSREVYIALDRALAESRLWASDKTDVSNSTRSARFVSDVCSRLNPLIKRAFPKPCPRLRHICVDDSAIRHAGEWLLDAVWTENARPRPDKRMSVDSPIRIRCALECESSTSSNEYHIDLAKLLVISSDIKLFLAGLNQHSKSGAKNYIKNRVCQTEQLLKSTLNGDSSTQWFLAFWPSPLNVRGMSMWQHLDAGSYPWLSRIVLYNWRNDAFQLEMFTAAQ